MDTKNTRGLLDVPTKLPLMWYRYDNLFEGEPPISYDGKEIGGPLTLGGKDRDGLIRELEGGNAVYLIILDFYVAEFDDFREDPDTFREDPDTTHYRRHADRLMSEYPEHLVRVGHYENGELEKKVGVRLGMDVPVRVYDALEKVLGEAPWRCTCTCTCHKGWRCTCTCTCS